MVGMPMREWEATGGSGAAASEVPEGLGLDVLAAWVGASPDGVVVLDDDLRIVYASPGYCAMFGHSPDRLLGQHLLTFIRERDRQTVLTHLADVRRGCSEPLLRVGNRADGSEVELEVRVTMLELQGRRFFVRVVRDVSERQQQARQAAALAQAAAACVASGDSIDAVLDAIGECALAGTHALAAWVTLADGDDLTAWAGGAGVPDEFRRHLRSGASTGACSAVLEALATRRVVVYADWRQQAERTFGRTCPLGSLPWQAAAFAHLLHRGAAVGLLTAIYREGEMPYAAETTFLAAL